MTTTQYWQAITDLREIITTGVDNMRSIASGKMKGLIRLRRAAGSSSLFPIRAWSIQGRSHRKGSGITPRDRPTRPPEPSAATMGQIMTGSALATRA